MKPSIGILCDGYFIGSGSGINTYIRHLSRMFIEMGYDVHLITDTPIGEKLTSMNYQKMGVHVHPPTQKTYNEVRPHTIDFEYDYVANEFLVYAIEFVKEYNPIAMFANSYGTSVAIKNIPNYNGKTGLITHIGDVMSPSFESVWDYQPDVTGAFLSEIDNDDIDLICQTEGVKKTHLRVLKNRTNAVVCHEPLYVNANFQLRKERNGVIVVAGNYKRKKIHDVIRMCGKAGLPLTIITNRNACDFDDDLDIACIRYGVEFDIIENIANDFVIPHIKSHRLMLHMSDVEVCPYSIIEAMPFIPCVIKKDVPWTDGFYPEYTIKVDIDDIDVLKEAYENYDQYPTIDLVEYQKECKASWVRYLS